MSLLGYLVTRGASSGPEPAATQALAYLLRESQDVARAFVDLVGQSGIGRFTPGRITAEEQHGDHSPDLTVRNAEGVVRILVENKFWAGLTDAQPVAYLEELPAGDSSALVFIVPHDRMYGLWGELREKCRRNEVELGSDSRTDAITWTQAGQRTLAITSWKHVLGALEHAAAAGGHSDLRQDILQLRGLTDRMNAEAFLPLSEDEVTGVNVPRRLINYSNLIEQIMKRLETEGIASRKGVRATSTNTRSGAYLHLHERFGMGLFVDLVAWRDRGITPIWSVFNTNEAWSGIQGKLRQAAELFDDAQEDNGRLYIPIRLTTAVDRDRVIDDAARQMHDIADRLRQAFPNP